MPRKDQRRSDSDRTPLRHAAKGPPDEGREVSRHKKLKYLAGIHADIPLGPQIEDGKLVHIAGIGLTTGEMHPESGMTGDITIVRYA